MKKATIIAVILLAAFVGLYFFTGQTPEQMPSQETPVVTSEDPVESVEMPIDQLGIRAVIMSQLSDAKVADLIDVSGGDSSGTGYILRKDDMLLHYVLADLPEPEGTNVYEGWLVRQGATPQFFSTGVMEVTSDGDYELVYKSETVSEGFDFVVITEETVVDATPEKHVIEGLAE